MKYVRTKLLTLATLTLVFIGHAQVKFPVTNNDLRTNLQKVLTDFPNQFVNIKGDVIVENPQSTDYASTLNFTSAESNSITQYSGAKPTYSWQATMLTTEDFDEASKKYKWLFNQLKAMTVKVGDYSYTLNGEYEAPEESKKFTTTTFNLIPAATNLPKVKIEASMQFEFPEWKVSLVVYQKEREDNERGDINDN